MALLEGGQEKRVKSRLESYHRNLGGLKYSGEVIEMHIP